MLYVNSERSSSCRLSCTVQAMQLAQGKQHAQLKPGISLIHGFWSMFVFVQTTYFTLNCNCYSKIDPFLSDDVHETPECFHTFTLNHSSRTLALRTAYSSRKSLIPGFNCAGPRVIGEYEFRFNQRRDRPYTVQSTVFAMYSWSQEYRPYIGFLWVYIFVYTTYFT